MKRVIFLAAAFIFLIACTHRPFPVAVVHHDSTTTVIIPPKDSTTIDCTSLYADTSVCFQRDVLPIFIGSCTQSGCHDAASNSDGYTLISYATIIAKGVVKYHSPASVLYTKCTNGKMPKAPIPKLDSTQLSFIRRWIDKGAPNDTDCAVACDTSKYTFAAAVAPILKTYCYGCHATAGAASSGGSVILDTYAGVLTQAQNGKLIADLNHATGSNYMPLGGNKLPDCQITQITRWIQAGALNN